MRKFVFTALLALLPIFVFAQSYLSVNDLLYVRMNLITNQGQETDKFLQKRGYTKALVYEKEDLYFYQNCRMVAIGGAYSSDGEYLKADKATENASYVHLSYSAISVFVHSKARMQTWIKQLKSLGYKRDTYRGGQDRFGIYWYYIKRGSPELRIIGKNSTYRLEVDWNN